MSRGVNLCEECNFNSRKSGHPFCQNCLDAFERERDEDLSCWPDDDDHYEDPPLYPPGALLEMTEEELQKEWNRQCRIHDRGVDSYEMGHPVIEEAQSRLNLIEREQSSRGFRKGPARDGL